MSLLNKIRSKCFNSDGSKRSGKNGATNRLADIQRAVKRSAKAKFEKTTEKEMSGQ